MLTKKIPWSILLLLQHVIAQGGLNLGSFGLGKGSAGDLLLNFGQGGSLFGLGADRATNLNIGPGRFGVKGDNGLTLGGQRLGLENLFGIQEGQGLNLGSFLNTGNPAPLGQFNKPPSDPLANFLKTFMGGGMNTNTAPKSQKPDNFIPNRRGQLAKGNERQPWETDGEEPEKATWPTPPSPVEENLGLTGLEKMGKSRGKDEREEKVEEFEKATESPQFPTLINMWGGGNDGFGNGNEESSGMNPFEPIQTTSPTPNLFLPQTTTKRINTEGWIGVSGSSRSSQKANMNSGEASKKTNGKRRGGPPPPEGMVDIDEAELRRIRALRH
ncbi:unnamed protein product [Bursaphelenchus okinawaensis]|uniref:Uncharacterized protein n=1 Tax=Bursaphelenchus okinawaensis TaxID=465554 RepID=A0A811K1Y9_9BILA|nr:unnamed protein product [Bursaphelenchus okinawaensis]CAG9089436.1 unnamed protein product [Bursaphelenchus okinawaensis]